MTATNVLFESTPRTQEIVDALARPAVRRIERLIRMISIGFVSIVTIPIVVHMLASGSRDTAASVLVVGICGVLPAWALRKLAPSSASCYGLVRHAVAYRATLISDRLWWGKRAPRILGLAWSEEGQRVLGHVTVFANIDTPDPQDIVVLVQPGQARIGVVLGTQGMFVGARGAR